MKRNGRDFKEAAWIAPCLLLSSILIGQAETISITVAPFFGRKKDEIKTFIVWSGILLLVITVVRSAMILGVKPDLPIIKALAPLRIAPVRLAVNLLCSVFARVRDMVVNVLLGKIGEAPFKRVALLSLGIIVTVLVLVAYMVRVEPSGPGARARQRAVWDGAGAQMFVLGGWDGSKSLDELWSYRPGSNTWTKVVPTGPPPRPRFRHSAVWDPAGAQMLVFGGWDVGSILSDLWSFRPGRSAWVQITPVGMAPSARYLHSAVWDPVRAEMLVFGGYDGSRLLDELWSYRPAGNTWTKVLPAGPAPRARLRHTAVWDSAGDQMLVFGGSDRDIRFNDLWSYRPSSTKWIQLTPAGPIPITRDRHSAVWDPAGAQMLIFAGGDGFNPLSDLWRYRPSRGTWTELFPAGPAPSARYLHSAVWDSAGAQMLVFGGWDDYTVFDDLWSYHPGGNTWVQLAPEARHPRAVSARAGVERHSGP